MNKNKKILFLIQYDSFLNTFIPIFNNFKKNKINFEIILLVKLYKKNWINPDIKEILNNYNHHKVFTTRSVYKFLDKSFNCPLWILVPFYEDFHINSH